MLPTAEDYENVIETLEAQCEALQVEIDDLQKVVDNHENQTKDLRDSLQALVGDILWY
jgi:chaperonin cofactor prefoldin